MLVAPRLAEHAVQALSQLALSFLLLLDLPPQVRILGDQGLGGLRLHQVQLPAAANVSCVSLRSMMTGVSIDIASQTQQG